MAATDVEMIVANGTNLTGPGHTIDVVETYKGNPPVNEEQSVTLANVKSGTFPRQVQLGPRAVGWLESEVSDWIAERVRMARGAAKSAG